jgi:hypothetical protein
VSLETRINLIGESLRELVPRLSEYGFEFERAEEVLPGPEVDTQEAIARIEKDVGLLPEALKLFWLRIGSVDLCGSHPNWEGAEYPDPLYVAPPSFALQELENFLSDKEERLRCNFPYHVPIAPDEYHKANVSGGPEYSISVPAIAADPPLNDEWHKTTFVNYLEIALTWAGFPGLSRYPGHNWPIEELVGRMPN